MPINPSCLVHEVAPTAEVLEDLAQKYTFHFIGDSTTRRLAESFVSIFSGEGSPHPMAHERTDFSSKNLKVSSGREGNVCVGDELLQEMEETYYSGRQDRQLLFRVRVCANGRECVMSRMLRENGCMVHAHMCAVLLK